MLYSWLRPALFTLDPERAHGIAMGLMAALDAAGRLVSLSPPSAAPELTQEIWGLRFANPIGLAAGFDKDARVPHAWSALGFGFAELGTITAEAQAGNPRPRLFRLPADRALINRMGFNNTGASAVAGRLRRTWRRPAIPIGINIGKSRSTPLDAAAGDYTRSLQELFPFADYFAINVSSPNTPGLRDLQGEEELAVLLRALGGTNRDLARQHRASPRPLLVKIAPDLGDEEIAATARVARTGGASGLIAANTTLGRGGLRTAMAEEGGLSGAPLRERATEVIRIAHGAAGGALPIIGVGGVFDADDAYEKIRAGASLVQLYTGFVYEGPMLPRRIVAGLRQRLRSEGVRHLRDVIGRDA